MDIVDMSGMVQDHYSISIGEIKAMSDEQIRKLFEKMERAKLGIKPGPYPKTYQALIAQGNNKSEVREMIQHFVEELEEAAKADFFVDPVDIINESLGLEMDYLDEFLEGS